jgi:hypothetical protein
VEEYPEVQARIEEIRDLDTATGDNNSYLRFLQQPVRPVNAMKYFHLTIAEGIIRDVDNGSKLSSLLLTLVLGLSMISEMRSTV